MININSGEKKKINLERGCQEEMHGMQIGNKNSTWTRSKLKGVSE
jgi:hypothetical protein